MLTGLHVYCNYLEMQHPTKHARTCSCITAIISERCLKLFSQHANYPTTYALLVSGCGYMYIIFQLLQEMHA